MPHNKIKNAFLFAVDSVIADPERFASNTENHTRHHYFIPGLERLFFRQS